ncbi:hypothetical protein P6P90_01505 [Ectobacillus antri]|jgi:hypothetical protein|uniref:Uncharacterized protein n=1 Tax=Ectobacillus antri TaxID=2486280 RepID=A0ABT6H1P7_9BACI|nr:hypothetical protein [Ectobacillus antri]MDG4656003.1 hypothetical protein [Ectobacillus antri]MDG5752678.1 hypothetical protein [Ectobacillus antri]
MQRKMVYLALCDTCGTPKRITKYALRNGWRNSIVTEEYCNNCRQHTKIPEHLRKIAKELYLFQHRSV